LEGFGGNIYLAGHSLQFFLRPVSNKNVAAYFFVLLCGFSLFLFSSLLTIRLQSIHQRHLERKGVLIS
jgi:hypothetical protein